MYTYFKKFLPIFTMVLSFFFYQAHAVNMKNYCEKLPGIYGAEDIAIDHLNKVAYISSQDRRNPHAQGKIIKMDLKNNNIINTYSINKTAFHPHGIHYKDNYLYVINHINKNTHNIEIFKTEKNGFYHIKSLTNALLKDPDDLYAFNINKIYVTNFSKNNILFYNGQQWSIAAKDIAYANGITGYSQTQKIFAVSTLSKTLNEYSINKQDGSLKLIQKVPTKMLGDNLDKDQDGNLWLAGHLSAPSFLMHEVTDKVVSPSKIEFWNQSNKRQVIFQDDGRYLSTASVAVRYKNNLYVGTVYESYILKCKIPDNYL